MDSKITLNKDGSLSMVQGTDAMELMQVSTLRASLGLYRETDGRVIPTRGMGVTRMLALATKYTGQRYKRTEIVRAEADLLVWIETMKSAIPYERE